MNIRPILRYDSGIKLLRLVRIVWGKDNLSHQLTLGVRANKLFGYVRGFNEVIATAFGIRVHYRCSLGGRFAA